MIGKSLKILIMLSAISSCGNENPQHNVKDMKEMDNENLSDQQIVYTCPMHPEIIRYEQGICPVCGMNLVEKKTDGKKSDEDLHVPGWAAPPVCHGTRVN